MPEPLRIIVADDHAWVRDVVGHLIHQTLPAAQVVAARDGAQAWAALEQGGCDLLMIDQGMPPPDGLALIQRVRARAPTLPILMVSVQPGIEAAALAAGATAFLPKYRLTEYLPGFLRRFTQAEDKSDAVAVPGTDDSAERS